MSEQVDARGFSCPQPVLLTMEKLRTLSQGELVVLVDTDTSRENVSRAAASLGWQVKEVQAQGEEYRITLQKANRA
jgi:tRNA 2-thiouridine synthesizing protein A